MQCNIIYGPVIWLHIENHCRLYCVTLKHHSIAGACFFGNLELLTIKPVQDVCKQAWIGFENQENLFCNVGPLY